MLIIVCGCLDYVCSPDDHTVVLVLTMMTVQSDQFTVHNGVMLFCNADIVCCVVLYHSSTETSEKTYESIVATQLHISYSNHMYITNYIVYVMNQLQI